MTTKKMHASSATCSGRDSDGEVYLDYAASTPCDPAVLEAMMPYLLAQFANPSSIHRAGLRAAAAVEKAREALAAAIGAMPAEIAFTGGATESNNLAILGLLARAPKARCRIISTAVEHASILGPCRALAARGFDVEICPVEADGTVDLGVLASLLDERTALLSIQFANNEVGTIQPVREAARLAHAAGALVHCDAAQAFGKIAIDVQRTGLDLMSMSGHKCYGPKGVGALFIRSELINRVEPLAYGGDQERGLRPGTPDSASIVGFGCAISLLESRRHEETLRIASLRDGMERDLLAQIEDSFPNGCHESRISGLLSLTIPGVDADALIASTPDLMISSSSACHAGAPGPSRVLLAMGLSRQEAYSTVRIGVGRFTTTRDVERAVELISRSAERIRRLSA